MAQLQARLDKYIRERKKLHEKMNPLYDKLAPFVKRLAQVNRNIATIKVLMKKENVKRD